MMGPGMSQKECIQPLGAAAMELWPLGVTRECCGPSIAKYSQFHAPPQPPGEARNPDFYMKSYSF